MKKEKYQKMISFLNSQKGITQLHKDVVIRKVMENYYSSIVRVSDDDSVSEISDTEKDVLENSIVSDGNIQNYLDSASTMINDWEEGKEKLLKKHINTGSFWKSVGASMLASLLYSIILIIVFWIAKNQISDWLLSLSK